MPTSRAAGDAGPNTDAGLNTGAGPNADAGLNTGAGQITEAGPGIEEFVAVRGEALVRFALMLCGNRHSAEDLVQAVLAKAIPRWARVAALERPEAYVKKMLVNEHLSWRNRRWHGEVPTALPGGSAPPLVGDGTDEHAHRDEAWALLGRLPAKQRAVLVLRYYEDLPDAEIATVLGCRTSTVRSQAARGLAALRSAFPAARPA